MRRSRRADRGRRGWRRGWRRGGGGAGVARRHRGARTSRASSIGSVGFEGDSIGGVESSSSLTSTPYKPKYLDLDRFTSPAGVDARLAPTAGSTHVDVTDAEPDSALQVLRRRVSSAILG